MRHAASSVRNGPLGHLLDDPGLPVRDPNAPIHDALLPDHLPSLRASGGRAPDVPADFAAPDLR